MPLEEGYVFNCDYCKKPTPAGELRDVYAEGRFTERWLDQHGSPIIGQACEVCWLEMMQTDDEG